MPQLVILGSELPDSAAQRMVQSLAQRLAESHAGWTVQTVTASKTMTPYHFRKLKQTIDACHPAVIHVFGPVAARWLNWLRLPRIGLQHRPKYVVSYNAATTPGPLGFLQRRANRLADAVVAFTAAEATQYRDAGIAPHVVKTIPPGVEPVATTSHPDGEAFRHALQIPQTARIVMAGDGQADIANLNAAVWAFDMVKYVVPDLYLVLLDTGAYQDRLRQMSHAIAFDDYRVRFTQSQRHDRSLLTHADVVWIMQQHGAVHLALEAMAHGKPVLARRTPELQEIIEENVTGRFLQQNDKVELAAMTRLLLQDHSCAQRLGDAGRMRAASHFAIGAMVERFRALYDDLMRKTG